MNVSRIVNAKFLSNTFIISEPPLNWIWLIDIGDFDGVINLITKSSIVRGVFITHPHVDHIYGLNDLIDFSPDCIVYISEHAKTDLYSDKLNLSYYHGEPTIFKGSNLSLLHEADKIRLFENCVLEVLETPGHHRGCLTYKVRNYIFTGDSYIPGIKVITKLRGGNREDSEKSIIKILNNVSENIIICQGMVKKQGSKT